MKKVEHLTNLPERRQMERPQPEKKPKWSKYLGMALRGTLIWVPRLWKIIDLVFGWFN